jgi:hypothetical protein
MGRRLIWLILPGSFGVILAVSHLLKTTLAYPEHPPLAHTGGFGEPTCQQCHFDQTLNDPEGSLTLEGLPETYTAGTWYRLTVNLRRPNMRKGGFQLAARFKTGKQAGSLRAVDERVELVQEAFSEIQYAQHTRAGTSLVSSDTARWTVEWMAPTTGKEVVIFNVVANAANDDASQFGDYIYVRDFLSKAR